MKNKAHVCVIGSGAAGLACGRRLVEKELSFKILERGNQVGGTWVYTREVGSDRFGLPVHSSMYKSLRTNLPKEIMGYPDFPIPGGERSYLPASEILSFLNSYCDHFSIRQHIKFNHHVTRVTPKNGGWEVTAKDLLNNKEIVEHYDAVMVCNGHYHTPYYSKLEGVESFKGKVLHSHDYREPEVLSGLRVLVVGAGPSGIDLALEVASTASNVVLSKRPGISLSSSLPPNLTLKPEVTQVQGDTFTFTDGTSQQFDVLFYCTGYKYSLPFLTEEAGVRVIDNAVTPLYRHLLSINHPTSLCFIGLPYYVCAFSLFDLQARYFLKVLEGKVELPSREEMLADTEAEAKAREADGLSPSQFHMMGPRQAVYYRLLSEEACLTPLPPVMASLHDFASERQLNDLANFRNNNYRIIDDSTFIKVN